MLYRGLIGAIVLVALAVAERAAHAGDDAKYPDWAGQWERFEVRGLPGQPSFDQTRPWGPGQQAPLTAEYRKVLEDSMANQAQGGHGNNYIPRCWAAGMPRMMIGFRPLEFIITPSTTYILLASDDHLHRWPRLAASGRADLCRLLDRQMDRCDRRGPL